MSYPKGFHYIIVIGNTLLDLEFKVRDFPGTPVVKTLPSSVGGAGWIPGWGAKIQHAS